MNGHYAMYYTTVAVAVVFPFFFSCTHIHVCMCVHSFAWDGTMRVSMTHCIYMQYPPTKKINLLLWMKEQSRAKHFRIRIRAHISD